MKIKEQAKIRRLEGVKQGKPYTIPGNSNCLIGEAEEEMEDTENYLTDAIKDHRATSPSDIYSYKGYYKYRYSLITALWLNRLAYWVLP